VFAELSLATGLFLLSASFLAGFVDSIAGGGGIVQLPALLIGLPNSPAAEVLGTNKLSAVFGTTTAAALYRKQIKPDPKVMLILVATLGYAFITASAIAKVVNVATNVGALIVFGINGAVIWQIGIIMGFANITGAIIGSRLAIKGGSTLVRKVFLLVTIVLIVRVGIATF